MPVHSEKEGKHYIVTDDKGKVYGRHSTQAKATAQVRAVNISEGLAPRVKPKGKNS